MKMTLIHRAAAAVACLVALSSAASAQLVTSTVPRQRTLPLQETLERSMSEAPWHLGAFRLQPRVTLSNFGYNNNVLGGTEEEAIDDWTATVGVGLDAYLPLGAKGVFQARLIPEYSWYQELTDLSNFGGTYQGSLFGFFNRMTVEASGFTQDTQTAVSSEREGIANRVVTGGVARVEVELLRRLSVFGGAEQRSFEYENLVDIDDPELAVEELDRDDTAARAGVRYRWSSFFDVSVLSETTKSEFVLDPLERDNESEAILLGVHYDRPKFFVNLTGGTREGSPANGSSFPEYSETTGSWFAEYRLTAPIDIQGFGSRDVVYGLYASNPYFLENRNGAAIRVQFGRRLVARVAAESGDNAYPIPVLRNGEALERTDDVSTIAGTLSIPLLRNLALTFGASQSDYDSNIPGYDRSVLRWTSTIGLRREIFR